MKIGCALWLDKRRPLLHSQGLQGCPSGRNQSELIACFVISRNMVHRCLTIRLLIMAGPPTVELCFYRGPLTSPFRARLQF